MVFAEVYQPNTFLWWICSWEWHMRHEETVSMITLSPPSLFPSPPGQLRHTPLLNTFIANITCYVTFDQLCSFLWSPSVYDHCRQMSRLAQVTRQYRGSLNKCGAGPWSRWSPIVSLFSDLCCDVMTSGSWAFSCNISITPLFWRKYSDKREMDS